MAAIITEKFRLQNAGQFEESFSESNEHYYMFLGKSSPFTSGTSGGTGSFGTVNMVRWYGQSSGHSRVIHFQNNNTNTIAYANTGSGSNSGIQSGFTSLSGHNANLPGSASVFQSGWTDFAYYTPGNYHWGLKGGNRWEVDDYANGSQHNTLHRVWVRYAS